MPLTFVATSLLMRLAQISHCRTRNRRANSKFFEVLIRVRMLRAVRSAVVPVRAPHISEPAVFLPKAAAAHPMRPQNVSKKFELALLSVVETLK